MKQLKTVLDACVVILLLRTFIYQPIENRINAIKNRINERSE